MSKCSGVIGYALAGETRPGVWSEDITEKQYYGDIVRDNRKIIDQSQINSNITINNNISVTSNKFMLTNMAYMRYVTFMGSKWSISSIDIKPPKLIITMGGLYNG